MSASYNSATSSDNAQFEPLPYDGHLARRPSPPQDGCLYSGPTDDHPVHRADHRVHDRCGARHPVHQLGSTSWNQTSGTNQNDTSTNPNSCGPVTRRSPCRPTGSSTSQTATSSQQTRPGVLLHFASVPQNPFDGGQLVGPVLPARLLRRSDRPRPTARATPSSSGTVSGALTDRDPERHHHRRQHHLHADCGSSFNSTYRRTSARTTRRPGHRTTRSGLIAFAYVEVDRPVTVTTTGG